MNAPRAERGCVGLVPSVPWEPSAEDRAMKRFPRERLGGPRRRSCRRRRERDPRSRRRPSRRRRSSTLLSGNCPASSSLWPGSFLQLLRHTTRSGCTRPSTTRREHNTDDGGYSGSPCRDHRVDLCFGVNFHCSRVNASCLSANCRSLVDAPSALLFAKCLNFRAQLVGVPERLEPRCSRRP